MKRTICVVLVIAILSLWGCAHREEENENVEVLYCLTEMIEVDDEGNVFFRMTYHYDERGLVTGYEIDDPVWEKEWNDQELLYETTCLPCDGVVNRSGSYDYDDWGNLVSIMDNSFLGMDGYQIDYTYNHDGRITSYTIIRNDKSQESYRLEYYGETVQCWYLRGDSPMAVAEYTYENEMLKNICYYPNLSDGSVNHAFTYEKGHMVCYTTEDDARWFTYDRDGRLLTSDTYSGDHQFSYEDGMLASIDGVPFDVETKENGTLEARYGRYVLTYTPVALKKSAVSKARSMWRVIFGEARSTGMNHSRDIFCGVVHPHALMDTVLMVPKGIY